MDSKGLRKEFLNFFEKKRHKIVPSSSLLPTDPTVLFTTAGMQQFKEYFLGKESPYGKNVCSCQKCFRTSDIDNVGDTNHLTFLEMLGHFSFGEYFKEEAIKLAFEFLFKELKLPLEDSVFTVFAEDKDISEDKESAEVWKSLGVPEEKIRKCSREDNFWGPTGEEGPCGPTTEIHIKNIEIWNLVFNEYYQDKNKKLTPLKQKGVDTGMGLERLVMVIQNKPSVYETDLFSPIMVEISSQFKEQSSSLASAKASANEKAKKIISDHIKSSVFLISEDILPSNVERGYVLRRVLRRAIGEGRLLNLPSNFLIPLAQKVVEIYKDIYPELKSKEADILTVIQNEEEKFEKTLVTGINSTVSIVTDPEFDGEKAYNWYATSGVPFDIIKEIAETERRIKLDKSFELGFERARLRHQEVSRAGAEKKFGGVGKEAGYESVKLHTATHLLHAALRKVLGEHVKQMGSDITAQRLRFDFSHSQKMTGEEIKQVEDLVNQKIKEDLEVKKTEMKYEDAISSGALAFFKEKYPEKVTVFSVGDFSKEVCGGPHVKRTSELEYFKIIKEESCGAGVRRIRAVLK